MRRRSKKRSATNTQTLPTSSVAWVVLLVMVALVAAYVALSRWAIVRVPAAVVQSQIIALTNDERTANDVGSLAEDPLLDQAAAAKAADMAQKGYFAHVGPDGMQPWVWITAAGYDYQYAGENLAVRFTDSGQVVSAWMASPSHRANIVKPQYTAVGVGVVDGTYEGVPATFVVQFFGAPGAGVVQASTPVATAAPTPSAAPAAGAAVAGAQAPAPAALPAHAPSLWERLMIFVSSTLHSLVAGVADFGAPPPLIDEGVSTQR